MTYSRMMSLCVKVRKKDTNDAVQMLIRHGNLNSDLKIAQDGDFSYIPVRNKEGKFIFMSREFEYRMGAAKQNSFDSKAFMETFREPSKRRWIKLGNALIIKSEYIRSRRSRNLSRIAEAIGVESIYEDMGISKSIVRTPEYRLIYGHGGIITHRENGVLFSFNPALTMFSPGNINVRVDISKIDIYDKVVFDMFAGIGYFSLPIAKYGHLRRLYASEINPVSYSFLEMNIRKNRVQEKISPFLGDCRLAFPGVKADLIIMGHFDSPNYIASALVHSHAGTLINFHVLSDGRVDTIQNSLQSKAKNLDALIDPLDVKVVKSYGPKIYHLSVMMRVARFL